MKIASVTVGATRREGGTRKSKVSFGGANSLPFHNGCSKLQPAPIIAHDIFDIPLHLPSQVSRHYQDVMEDPASWAKKQVEDFGAQVITLHLVGIDPQGKDKSVKQACKDVEEVLQAVKVPLIVGGCGNSQKDAQVLPAVAQTAAGENCIISSIDLGMDWKPVAEATLQHGHSILCLASMNVAEMRRLTLNLLRSGFPPEKIVLDLFTGGIGYGIEHTISAFQRARLAGIGGERALAMPLVAATSNAWSCREAWQRNDQWGPKELRGPLWEESTALLTILAGADLLFMLNPQAIKNTNHWIDMARKEVLKYDGSDIQSNT